MTTKYWEVETPQVFQSEKNEVRVFAENGKVQVFPKISSGRGIGKGATIDLAAMNVEQLATLETLIQEAIAAQVKAKKGEGVSA